MNASTRDGQGRRPNLFVIGGPRSGTTSLFRQLTEHPGVYTPDIKEPNFFCSDLAGIAKVKNERDYLRLFEDATPDHTVIAEASVWYLSSHEAPKAVHAFNPDAKIVALLRNPLDLVQSLHEKLRVVGWEDEPNLAKAISLESARRAGDVDTVSPTARVVQYTRLARHGRHLERWLEHFPEEQLLVVLFEDLTTRGRETWLRVLDFLGLPDDGKASFPHFNAARVPRGGWVGQLIRTTPGMLRAGGQAGRRTIRAAGVNDFRLMGRLVRALSERQTPEGRAPLDGDLRDELVSTFDADMDRLSSIVGQDMHEWLRKRSS